MTTLAATARTAGGWVVIEVVGELDFHTAAQLRAAVEEQVLGPERGLVLDLGGLTFCDSSGITAMLVAQQRVRSAEASIALAAMPVRVSRVFALAGLDHLFTVYPTAAEATAAAPS